MKRRVWRVALVGAAAGSVIPVSVFVQNARDQPWFAVLVVLAVSVLPGWLVGMWWGRGRERWIEGVAVVAALTSFFVPWLVYGLIVFTFVVTGGVD